MTILHLLLFILFALACIGLILGAMSSRHLTVEDWGTQATHLSPTWCFHEEIYDQHGKRLCRVGRYLFWLNVVVGVVALGLFLAR